MPNPKHSVIVVEDDDGMRQAIERLLRCAGFPAFLFESAEALLESGAAETATCFVLDVRLPGLSGFELGGRLDQSGSHAPFIFITAHDDPRARSEAARLGALAYLPKPFPGKLLLDAVARSLEPAAVPIDES